jgi:hypothetical protein
MPFSRSSINSALSFTAILVSVVLAGATTVRAHEFWIAPLAYQIEEGAAFSAELRQGQNFIGGRFSYLPARFFSFNITHDGATAPVAGRIGDLPAIKSVQLEPGLTTITHYSRPTSLKYDEFSKFAAFLTTHGLERLIDRHRERGLPEQGFTERYRRTAKSLVQVGDASGADTAIGMPYELVAEANPYQFGSDALPVRLLWRGQGEPRTVIQIFIEGRKTGPDRVMTDDQGRAEIPISPGVVYMLNAVHIVELDGEAEESNAVWESYWASLTFAVPR